ncbi:PadR family transcriptional regulator [Microbacterium panaciterrae]|uniref:Helix-turn-helix transcriptional regulator n=1 Tax=Microbacterium panaciterrae TaxID=985759 RepID=A0ABP8PEA0_9MICO
MSVRQSLLAILDQGPCYGYQLRAEFDRRTGSTWPLNVGQIYNTLERLERDGLVARGDADDQGHVYWAITEAGSAEATGWLGSPVERGQGTRDELAIKLALAATLPGADVAAVIAAQRRASTARLERLQQDSQEGSESDRPEDLARNVILDAQILTTEAELLWLERVERRLSQRPSGAPALALSPERPRRGRPTSTAAL